MINVFLDTSGSISEMGKNSGAIYAAKSIQDYCHFHKIENNLYEFDGTVIEDLQHIEFNRNISIETLGHYINNNCLVGNIIISDGLFSDNMKIKNSVAVLIGVDADRFILEKIFLKVYESENIIPAIEYLLFHSCIETVEKVDDEDEW